MADTAVMPFGFGEVWDAADMAAADPVPQGGRRHACLAAPDLDLPPQRASWMGRVGYAAAITQHIGNDISDHMDADVPDSSVFSYHAYDALYVVANATGRVGPDYDAGELGAAIPVPAVDLSPTAAGFPAALAEDGDLAGSGYGIYRVEGGVFKTAALYG